LSDYNILERAALSLSEGSRARLARALLASLDPRDPDTAAWFGEAAKLVDAHLAEVQGPGAPPPEAIPGHEPPDPRLEDDPWLGEIRKRRGEIESGEISILEDRFILGELKRRLGFGGDEK
jgi:hypothetical protein